MSRLVKFLQQYDFILSDFTLYDFAFIRFFFVFFAVFGACESYFVALIGYYYHYDCT